MLDLSQMETHPTDLIQKKYTSSYLGFDFYNSFELHLDKTVYKTYDDIDQFTETNSWSG